MREIERASENPIMNAIFIKRLIQSKAKTADPNMPKLQAGIG